MYTLAVGSIREFALFWKLQCKVGVNSHGRQQFGVSVGAEAVHIGVGKR